MSKESPVFSASLPASLLGYSTESVASTQEDVLLLFDECAPGLRRYVAAFGLTAEVTEDVVQEAFLRAYRGLRGFKGQAKFSSWLYRITLNLCRDWMRRERRAPIVIDDAQYAQLAENWLKMNGADLAVSLKSNPIELGALLTLFVGLAMTGLFAWKRRAVVAGLPSHETLDLLLYRSVGVVFPLLTLVLVPVLYTLLGRAQERRAARRAARHSRKAAAPEPVEA